MRRRTFAAAVVAGAAMLAAVPATAQVQIPLSVEARLDGGIPVGDSGDLYQAGMGFGFRAAVDLSPAVALYGGFSRFEFDVDEDVLPGDSEIELETWEVGGRVGLDSRYGSANPYLLLGALFTEDETGVEAGIGADYAVSWEFSVLPEIRYRTIADVDYLTFGVGLRLRF